MQYTRNELERARFKYEDRLRRVDAKLMELTEKRILTIQKLEATEYALDAYNKVQEYKEFHDYD